MRLRDAAALVGIALCIVQSASALDRSPEGLNAAAVNVSGTATDSLTPVVATSAGIVHVAWIESEPTTDGLRATIWYVRSIDGGTSFESPRPIAPLSGYASALQCVVDNSVVHLAWLATSYTTGSPAAVDYQRSIDGGETFESFVSVSATTPPGAPVLVASSGRVAAVWQADERMWMARSTSSGLAFESPTAIGTAVSSRAATVRAAATMGGIAVAWLTPPTGGETHLGVGRVDWETGILAESPSPDAGLVVEVTATASDETVVVAWVASGTDRTTMVADSTDGGATYGEAISLGPAGPVTTPRSAVGDEAVYVSWIDPHGRLAVSRIASDGSAQKIRVRSNKRAVFPEIIAVVDGATVVWRSGSGSSSVVRSCDIGATGSGSTVRTVAKRGRGAVAPRIATVDGGRQVVAWQQLVGEAADVFVRTISN